MPASDDGSSAILELVERSLTEYFGVQPARAAVSFVGTESIEILRFAAAAESTWYVSLGMSRQPMTGASAESLNATGPRAELLVEVRSDAEGLWRHLAVLAASPMVEGVVYREGMTVDLGTPLVAGSQCTGGLIVATDIPAVRSGDIEIAILRVEPATASELAWCRLHGASALLQKWHGQRIDVRDLRRPAARLD